MQKTIKVNNFTDHADVDPVHTATVYMNCLLRQLKKEDLFSVLYINSFLHLKRKTSFVYKNCLLEEMKKEDLFPFVCKNCLLEQLKKEDLFPFVFTVRKLSPTTAKKEDLFP